jgi:hypothetical protein
LRGKKIQNAFKNATNLGEAFMITTRLLFSLGAGVIAMAAAGAANADAVSDFYKGTRMTMFVGSGAGGGYDTYTRAFV